MHKFIDNIVAFSLKNKFFIFFCTVIAVIAGAVVQILQYLSNEADRKSVV